MGRAKALMMEMEEAQWEETDVSFRCPFCKKDADGSVELPVVYENGNEELLPVSVCCFGCDSVFDGWVRTDWSSCEIKLDDYPDIKVEASPVHGHLGQGCSALVTGGVFPSSTWSDFFAFRADKSVNLRRATRVRKGCSP